MTPPPDAVAAPSGLLDRLRAAVGSEHVLVDPDTTQGHRTDWTGRFGGDAAAVVRPADTAEVAAVLVVCSDLDVPVVPQGGNTGLVGGGVPREGEVVLSLRRLDAVGTVDEQASTITVGAGATLAAVQGAARPHGLEVGVDLAARDSATIGGMVATNAGGVHVVAHGSMRQQVRGLEAVTADGRVLSRLAGLAKDNAGYDLPQLLAGSEGTLAVITRVVLRLVPVPASRTVAVVGCADVDDALAVLRRAHAAGPLRAAEVMDAAGLALVSAHLGVAPPIPAGHAEVVALLLEWAGEEMWPAIADLVGDRPAVVAQDAADIERLWRFREVHTEAIAAAGGAAKLDVTVPHRSMALVCAEVHRRSPGAVVFGHLAEGTLHVNLIGPGGPGAAEAVLQLVAGHGGSIASEHGVGIAKAGHLHLTRGPTDLAVMRALKSALDPAGILNPGVILPSDRRQGRR